MWNSTVVITQIPELFTTRPFKFPPGQCTQIFKFITDVQGNSKTREKCMHKSGELNHIHKNNQSLALVVLMCQTPVLNLMITHSQ